MTTQNIEFQFLTGLKREIFRNARLLGSWDMNGQFSDTWTEWPMQQVLGIDGCPAFTVTLPVTAANSAQVFKWGVILDGPQGANFWGIPTETANTQSIERTRSFTLSGLETSQTERYYFTYLRRLGANKFVANDPLVPSLHFAVWAPNAQLVEVVFGDPLTGYISDQGQGIDPAKPVIPLTRFPDGIWEGGLPDSFEHYKSQVYMYRIKTAEGQTVYKTDIYSRSQIGTGSIDPANLATPWPGTADTLDGTVSCSVIIDADVVRRTFDSTPTGVLPDLIPIDDFWTTEFTPGLPVPIRLEDLIIYELHIGALGFNEPRAGNLADALDLLDYLVDLGINAVELLPIAEFSGSIGWGYGDTHHLCIESSAGGRDKYRHFIRACHQRGIAVIQDVVYNHYGFGADRAENHYDSSAPEADIYLWYEGKSTDYPFPDGGYLDNNSSGRTPRFTEEAVRQQFISSAAFLMEEMHIDGFRVDLTQSIHSTQWLSSNHNITIQKAQVFGQKFLREWSRTLNMIRPTVMLIAEDYSDWDMVTKPVAQNGLGFNATWYDKFYHSLIGDVNGHFGILKQAGYGYDGPLLPIASFGEYLFKSQYNKIVYHENHDEAGNDGGSERTMAVALHEPTPLNANDVLFWKRMRSRLSFGLSILSAGTPLFFMGEEIGAQKPYLWNNFMANRENLKGERLGNGAPMFRFYQDLITLTRRFPSIRSKNIDVLQADSNDRIIAFKRWRGQEQVLIIASWKNLVYSQYSLSVNSYRLPDGNWKEIFNSDARIYGGANVGNGGAVISVSQGRISLTLPANGFIILVLQ